MVELDIFVVRSGSGMIVAAQAVANAMKTALLKSGSMGKTCINRGARASS